MTRQEPLDLRTPTPCVEEILAPLGLHLCRCAQHGACSATRVLAAAELTRIWATVDTSHEPPAAAPTDRAAALALATAVTTGVPGLETNMSLLAELVSARDLRFGEALAVTLAVMGLESARAA